MKKCFLSFVMAIICIFTISTVFSTNTYAQTFSDVKPKDLYYEAVESLAKQGIFTTNSEKFNPNNDITRGQLSKIMAMALKLDTKSVKNPGFKDVSTNHQFYPYIAALANKGIISGYTDGTFGVNKPVKKAHLAKFLVKGFELPTRAESKTVAPDVKGDTETGGFVATLSFYNIIDSGKYNPNANAKRQIVAKYIYNTIKNENMINNQKELKYPKKIVNKQELFSFSTTKTVVKTDYLTNTVVILPSVAERSFYLPLQNQNDKKVQFEVNENGEVVHFSLVDEVEPKYKEIYSFGETDYEYKSIPGTTVVEAKYENLFKPQLQAFYGEKELRVFPNWSKEVLKVNNLYNYTGDDLFTDIYIETLKLSDGQQVVKYYEMDEFDFEVFASELKPVTAYGYYQFVGQFNANEPYKVEGPSTYEYRTDVVFDEQKNYIGGEGFYFKGEGKYKVIQNNKVLLAVELKSINGQLFGKSLPHETIHSMVTTYEKLYGKK